MYTTCFSTSFKRVWKNILVSVVYSFPCARKNKHLVTHYPSFHKIATTTRFFPGTVKGHESVLLNFNNVKRGQCLYISKKKKKRKASLICFCCDNNFPFFTCLKLRYFPLRPPLSPHYITGRVENGNKRESANPLITRVTTKAKTK